MAPRASPSPAPERALQPDEIDDLFNYDVAMDDAFKSAEIDDTPLKNTGRNGNATGASAALGIDKELKITKQRQPIAKLDETRLLSAAGIPKLRTIGKKKLKFRGKGHEFSDVARLLNIYQFWLDDLYPRAKFADALTMIEKLGHTKRIQVYRKEWIHEGKPKPSEDEYADSGLGAKDSRHTEGQTSERTHHADEGNQPRGHGDSSDPIVLRDDPEADARGETRNPSAGPEEDIPAPDDLDALLDEDLATPGPTSLFGPGPPRNHSSRQDDDFADDLEAMQDLDGGGGW